MSKHGSIDHFNQVVQAHTLLLSGKYCRCGAPVADMRKHIAEVWLPYSLPESY